MKFIYEDLAPRKQAVIDYIEATWLAKGRDSHLNVVSRIAPDKMDALDELCSHLHVDHNKLRDILKSQIMSGNYKGAIKVVQGCQDKKFNTWGYLMITPITVPLALVSFILKAPLRVYWWIVRNV